MIFSAMALFWIAVWFLDFHYYNRLLVGAVRALRKLEGDTKLGVHPGLSIELSTLIEDEFNKPLSREHFGHFRGVLWFYGIVLAAIIGGVIFCLYMHGQN
jgi:hypothetical protein